MFNFSRKAIRQIPGWLWDIKYFWMTAALNIAAVSTAICLGTEPAFRWIGLALQLAGGFTVWWAIAETHQSFGKPSVFTRTSTWLRKFPLTNQLRSLVLNVGVASIGLAGGHMEVRHRPGANATIEQQLAMLKEDFDRLNAQHVTFVSKTNQKIEEQRKLLDEESDARKRDRKEIDLKIEETATGGLHIPSIGGVLIVVGSILGTLSVELASWLT